MGFNFLKTVVFLAVFRISACFSEGSMKTIYLSDVAPQGILRIGTTGFNETITSNGDANSCDYLITSNQISSNANNKNISLSVGALFLDLNDGVSVEITPYSVGNTKKDNERNGDGCSKWKQNVKYNPKNVQKECKTTGQDLCINLKGTWTEKSKAILLLSYHYESDKFGNCPSGTIQCNCNGNAIHDRDDSSESEEDDDHTKFKNSRCIPQDLACNGVSNCGLYCDHDESLDCSSSAIYDDYYSNGSCTWTKFEYFAMMVMSGLLLVLIPIVFLLTLLHHKARRRGLVLRQLGGASDGNNNQVGRYPHVISTHPVHLDNPPTYEELPEEVKMSRPTAPQQNTSQA